MSQIAKKKGFNMDAFAELLMKYSEPVAEFTNKPFMQANYNDFTGCSANMGAGRQYIDTVKQLLCR